MKYSTKLSDAVHLAVFIYLSKGKDTSSTKIAESIKTNPGYIRQLMVKLKKGGIIATSKGKAQTVLAQAPENLTLLDFYKATEGNKPLLHWDTHTNPECGVGVNIQYAIADYYDKVQNAAYREMEKITLADIIETYNKKVTNLCTVCIE